MCLPDVAGEGPERYCAGEASAGWICAALDAAGHGDSSVSSDRQRGVSGDGSGPSCRPRNHDSQKQTGPRGRASKDSGRMAHDTQHAKTLPADLGAPAFVDAWKTRALIIGLVFSVIAAGLGFARWHGSTRSFSARVGVGPDAHLRLGCGWAGAADGAVCDRRQMGIAAAPAAGSDEPNAAAGLCLLAGDGDLDEEALPLGAGDGSTPMWPRR